MNLLITGIHGFVGSNLVKNLSKNNTIYGLDIINPEKDGVVKTFSWDDLDKDLIPNIDEKIKKQVINLKNTLKKYVKIKKTNFNATQHVLKCIYCRDLIWSENRA